MADLGAGAAAWVQADVFGTFGILLAWADANGATGSLLTATVALLVFLFTQALSAWFRRYDRATIRRRLVIGLYAEIESNLREIRDFVDQEAFFRVVREKTRREAEQGSTFRPTIVITESSRFFSANAGLIPELRMDALVPLMEFYRLLEELGDRRDAFESKAYETLSPDGRAGLVDDLMRTGLKARDVGLHTLHVLKEQYPVRWFRALKQAEARMPQEPARIGRADEAGSDPNRDGHSDAPMRSKDSGHRLPVQDFGSGQGKPG